MNIKETLKMLSLSGLGNHEIKVYVVCWVLGLVFKTVFGMFFEHLVCLKSVKKDVF
jgi:hypothetical protein